MKNSMSAIKHAHFLGIFACALFVGAINADIYNISLLEKDGKKVVLFYDVHEEVTGSERHNVDELETIIKKTQKEKIRTHWLLEWSQATFKTSHLSYSLSINSFSKNAFRGKYDNPYTTIESFDLRPLSFNFLNTLNIMQAFLNRASLIESHGISLPPEMKQSVRRFELLNKAHTPKKYIYSILDRTQQMIIMLNHLEEATPYIKNIIMERYEESAQQVINMLKGSNSSLYETWTQMTPLAQDRLDFASTAEACLYVDIFMVTQILNMLKESPETAIFVYAGGAHCRDVALILHSMGFQEHFEHPIKPLRYTNFEQDLDVNLYYREETLHPLRDYAIDVLNFIRQPQNKKRGQQPAPGISIERKSRYYPTDPYKKALDAAMWRR